MKKGTRGFTLIELLVVISIIGILAAVVLVALGGARTKGINSKIVSEVISLRTALELNRNGNTYLDMTYPANISYTTEAVFDYTLASQAVKNIVNDILAQNPGKLYASGSRLSGPSPCGGANRGIYSASESYSGGGVYSNYNNPLVVYVNYPSCVAPSVFAIYAAYAPMTGGAGGGQGYYCADSTGATLSVATGWIPSSVAQNDGKCH